MLNAVHIQGYRGLRDFTLEPLARINLIVGNNNSGKTSVLEAIQILVEQDTLAPLYEITRRRNEMIEIPPKIDRPGRTLHDLSHIFTGHRIDEGAELAISGSDETGDLSTQLSAAYVQRGPVVNINDPDDEIAWDSSEWPFKIKIAWNGRQPSDTTLTRYSGGFQLVHRPKTPGRSSVFIHAAGLGENEIVDELNRT